MAEVVVAMDGAEEKLGGGAVSGDGRETSLLSIISRWCDLMTLLMLKMQPQKSGSSSRGGLTALAPVCQPQALGGIEDTGSSRSRGLTVTQSSACATGGPP